MDRGIDGTGYLGLLRLINLEVFAGVDGVECRGRIPVLAESLTKRKERGGLLHDLQVA